MPKGADLALSPKKAKELRRQWRRLAGEGDLRVTSATTPAQVRDALEAFLAIEARGWKGAKGTALLNDPGLTAFTRAALRGMALEGKCAIHLLARHGQPIAGAIVLAAHGRAFYWKTTFDEAYAAFSPGVLLSAEVSRLQLERGDVELTDSGAIENHPMIDHLWAERLEVADLMMEVRPGGAFAALAARENLMRGLKRRAKAAVARVRAAKRS